MVTHRLSIAYRLHPATNIADLGEPPPMRLGISINEKCIRTIGGDVVSEMQIQWRAEIIAIENPLLLIVVHTLPKVVEYRLGR
jgi:hypothetical protein